MRAAAPAARGRQTIGRYLAACVAARTWRHCGTGCAVPAAATHDDEVDNVVVVDRRAAVLPASEIRWL